MATPQEYMLADLAYLFAEEGGAAIDLMIDGDPLRAIPQPEDCVEGEIEGQLVFRLRYQFLASAFSTRLGEEREIEGRKWRVVSLSTPPGLVDVTFERTTA